MAQPTTRLQVSGHRFLARRMEHALVRGDPRLLDDPLRAQTLSFSVGVVLAVVGLAVCAVLAFVRPADAIGDAPLVVVRDSGAMYVRIDGVMHPVFNLASARLILGAAAEARVVSQRAVDNAELGPQMGIPGAPQQISPPLTKQESGWTVCDDERSGTTVLAGPLDDAASAADRSVLVSPRGASAAVTYLLHGGWRARVDLRHAAVVRALRLDGVVPQQVSPLLLDAIPEAPAIEPPRIPALGAAGPLTMSRYAVGTVVQVPAADGVDHFVVLPDGLQRVGEVAADLIRYTDSRSGAEIPTVSAADIGAVPVTNILPVATFPDRANLSRDPVICARWRRQSGRSGSYTAVLVAAELPAAARSVPLAQADGAGPAIDAVSVPAGRSVFVRSVSLTGSGAGAGSLFLVTAAGLRFGIRDAETAAALGITASAEPAPWPVLSSLPPGPELSRPAASVVSDAVGAP
ncbi:type VII secretion protein EccB [Mycobacterium sp. smrl_JER01]|uniref:type VII secretion protein EccB n=1 Tax=Mycobacterium sp. smrl_JER01 TaxID=3402633 RepID=UPI003AC724F1